MNSTITRGKLKTFYKRTSLCSSATPLQQLGISCMELSRVLQYICVFSVARVNMALRISYMPIRAM